MPVTRLLQELYARPALLAGSHDVHGRVSRREHN